ncbi:RNA polymerase sigma-70 factor [Microlunatus capsulatus]|uniref:RNA polymerase sigma-70 factor (ECF subfamily) n=1 Tax=Microlunatus capsulatus TaxID=99117 RepID=A0ABS4Z7Z2_9ACTN|nr:RNA polymerase sigma-70 factor [Microlunatus capsulatus]MBP2417160.1 RNA polymerase sigma-70 factor (ECF subfamily) [Microlunatus capsulatus]
MTQPAAAGGGDLDDAAAVFAEVRPRLFGIAYRMLGSWSEAEDVVQDTWLRWQGTDRGVVRTPVAFLVTTTTRLCLNVVQSARARRETYTGPWLPEPVDTAADPTLAVEQDEAVELAVLLVLERLTPTERAAYVLRESFDYPYAEIAEILQLGQPNVRQLVSRARRHIAGERRVPVSREDHRRLLEAFLVAARTGDAAALESLLSADVVSYSDGDGAARVARRPVAGPARVARFVAAFRDVFWPRSQITWVEANGRPAVLVVVDGSPQALLSVTASERGIEQVQWMMNRAKLAAWERSGGGAR